MASSTNDDYPPTYVPGTGVLKVAQATLTDGVQQEFGSLHAISFENVHIPLQFVADNQDGGFYIAPASMPAGDVDLYGDHVEQADIYSLTQGDDSFGFFEGIQGLEVNGRGGNDSLSSSFYGNGIILEGGKGNDTLWAGSQDRDYLLGGDGNDVLHIADLPDNVTTAGDKATGGAGADTFTFGNLVSGSSFITDFQATGAAHDVLDISEALHIEGYDYARFADAVAAGTIGISYLHGYTYLSFDANGDHVPDNEFAHMKGVFGSSTWDDFIV